MIVGKGCGLLCGLCGPWDQLFLIKKDNRGTCVGVMIQRSILEASMTLSLFLPPNDLEPLVSQMGLVLTNPWRRPWIHFDVCVCLPVSKIHLNTSNEP